MKVRSTTTSRSSLRRNGGKTLSNWFWKRKNLLNTRLLISPAHQSMALYKPHKERYHNTDLSLILRLAGWWVIRISSSSYFHLLTTLMSVRWVRTGPLLGVSAQPILSGFTQVNEIISCSCTFYLTSFKHVWCVLLAHYFDWLHYFHLTHSRSDQSPPPVVCPSLRWQRRHRAREGGV